MKRFLTPLGLFNILILQWLFIRLARCKSCDTTFYGIIGFILPFTGWSNRYFLIGSMFNLRITSKKKITAK